MPEPVAPLSGRCMCGAVEFSVSEPLLGALYCHCKRCQRRTGSAFAVTGLVPPGSFAVVRGVDVLKEYRPSDGGWVKSFCTECGSHLFTSNPDDPEYVAVRFGALDQDPGVRPSAHQFVDYAAPWEPLPDDGFPRFRERLGSDQA
jgi:hypothetical protein